jgi:REP element-mobilizing transposase RayT
MGVAIIVKKIIYCTNIHSQRDAEHLIQNVKHINQMFDNPLIFVANNGRVDPHTLDLTSNVTVGQFKYQPSPQLGPVNSLLNALRMVAEMVPDAANYNVIFTHADLYVRDRQLLESWLDRLETADVVCRNYTGPGGNKIPGVHYYMTEDILISGRVINRFRTLKFDTFENESDLAAGVLEITLAGVIDNLLQLKTLTIDIERQTECVINEMGFYHDHIHYRESMSTISSLCLLTHTHSDCFDVLPPHFAGIQRYFYDYYGWENTHYLLTNDLVKTPYATRQILYDDQDTFARRMTAALETITEPYVLFQLEDYILYDYVDFGKIAKFVQTMEQDPSVNFVRLLQSGVVESGDYNSDLIVLDPNSPYYFSTQATIWRRTALLDLLRRYDMPTVADEMACSASLRQSTGRGLCVRGRGRPVGGHFDSLVWPYIAAAVINRRWNISEYPEIYGILERHGIDVLVRGIR